MAAQLIIAGIGAGISAISAFNSYKAGKKAERLMLEGGKLSQAASYANAADAEALGALNASAINAAAANNAERILDIGYANAEAIMEATAWNLQMYKMESDERLRLHIMQERWHAGEIRAMGAASGFNINTGSPLAYLQSEITKGIDERLYMQKRDLYTMLGDAKDGLRRTLLTVKTANWDAKTTVENASIAAYVAMAEATAQAAAMRRQGDISAAVGVANAQAARYQGTSAALGFLQSGIQSGYDAYSAYKASQTPTSAPYASYVPGTYRPPLATNYSPTGR